MKRLFLHTPLLHSHVLSRITGCNIYLKLEALQPSGSFKDRGIGALCEYYAQQAIQGFICASGGNAGIAVAYAGQVLNVPAHIILPKTTPSIIADKLRLEKAQVIIEGDNWDAANELALKLAKENNLAYIPPFDHPVIWQGYTSLIEELKMDGCKPQAIIVSVGGGGLFTGLIEGLHTLQWQEVALITAETQGAASLATAMQEKKRVRLEKIDTIATTLGAKQICQAAFDWTQKHPVFPQVVSDKEAAHACLRFADDHRLLVEPAGGAALAVLYEKRPILQQFKDIVVIVCGGSGVSLSLLAKWKQQFNIVR